MVHYIGNGCEVENLHAKPTTKTTAKCLLKENHFYCKCVKCTYSRIEEEGEGVIIINAHKILNEIKKANRGITEQ